MLCDPLKYQDYVNKYLDGIEDGEEQRHRKRTRSNNFFTTGQQLPEIGEETYEQTAHQRPSNDQQDCD